jgi:hypothetical protein
MKKILFTLISSLPFIANSQTDNLAGDTIYLKNGDKYVGYLVAEEVKTYEFKLSNSKNLTSFPKGDVLKICQSEKNGNSISPTKSLNQSLFPVNSSGEIEYTEVIKVDSTSADVLYSRAKMSIAELFKSAQNVIQNDDAANKQILIKGSLKADYVWYAGSCSGSIGFTMTVFCKDNRYKYSIKPDNHECGVGCKFPCAGGNLLNEKPTCGTFNMPKTYWQNIQEKASADFLLFIETLKKKMATDVGGGNDW